MTGLLDNPVRLAMEQFHAFYNERPEHEKWELIDGIALMMPPPMLMHQRIARNLDTLLNRRLQATNPQWQSDRAISVRLPKDERYNPEPDVTVIDTEIGLDQIYAERFYFVAEVLSESNRPELSAGSDQPLYLAKKLAYYRAHEHCRAILFIRQDCIEATFYSRHNAFAPVILSNPGDRLIIPDIGEIGSLADLYRYTPLWPASR
jgi:Uma2 family endonuclease